MLKNSIMPVKNSNIQVTTMTTCELEKYSVQHLQIVFKNAIPVPAITGFHFIEFTDWIPYV